MLAVADAAGLVGTPVNAHQCPRVAVDYPVMVYLGSAFALSGRQGCIGVGAGRGEAEVVCSFTSGAVEVYNVS